LSSEKDYDSAINYLNMGEDAAYHAGATYSRMLFYLTKGMVGINFHSKLKKNIRSSEFYLFVFWGKSLV